MGNQGTKVSSVRNSKHGMLEFHSAAVPGPGEGIVASRTNWTAGVPSPPGRPVIELSADRIAAPEDENSVTDEINLAWDVPDDDGGYPITGYRVEMLDIQSGTWIEITFIEGYEPKCTLSNILYGIMYRFRVVALNDAGSSEPGDPSDPIVIDVPGVQIAPYFVQMLNDCIALEHEKIEFRVRALGTPKPSLQWYKDDLEIFSCERIEMREEEDGGVVVLKGARFSDSGTIKCVATNILGRAVSTAQLVIEAAPRLEIPENYNDGLIFRQDEVIRLKVSLVAKPAPQVVWFFEDEPITTTSESEIQTETTESYTALRIPKAKRWHCGEFRVYAENENGEDACSILVTVTAPPQPPGKTVVVDISETRCTLRWDPSDDDGGADLRHYVVEYFRDVWNVWLKAKNTKECQVVIDDLIPGSRYIFRVKAENDYGISEPGEESDPFDVVSAPAGASGLPQQPSTDSEDAGVMTPSEAPSPSPSDAAALAASGNPTADGGAAPPKRSKKQKMAQLRNEWQSDDQPADENILDRFLKVKQFGDLKIPSCDSDGIPSIAPIEGVDLDSLSDVPDGTAADDAMDKTQRMFDDLKQIAESTDLETEDEDASLPDLTRSSTRNEQRTAAAAATDEDSISVSAESLSQLIPAAKKQSMNQFEETLKVMIEEARELAKTPVRELVEEEDEHAQVMSRYGEDGAGGGIQRDRSPAWERDRRAVKSPSVLSTTESVVSVIEVVKGGKADAMPMPAISVTADLDEPPASPRAVQQRKHSALQMLQQKLREDAMREEVMQRHGQVLPPTSSSMGDVGGGYRPLQLQDQFGNVESARPTKMRSADPSPGRMRQMHQQQQQQQQPYSRNIAGSVGSVGVDRYEELINTRGSRGSSQTGSQTDIYQRGRDLELQKKLRGLEDDPTQFLSGRRGSAGGGVGVGGSRPGTLIHTGPLSASNRSLNTQQAPSAPMISPSPVGPAETGVLGAGRGAMSNGFGASDFHKRSASNLATGDNRMAGGIGTTPKTTTSNPVTTANSSKFQPKPIEVMVDPTRTSTEAAAALEPRKAFQLPPNILPKNFPQWFVLTYTYSAVLIAILLISNWTPDGQLYIHFVAFWSLVLYFYLDEEDGGIDPLESVIEGFVGRRRPQQQQQRQQQQQQQNPSTTSRPAPNNRRR